MRVCVCVCTCVFEFEFKYWAGSTADKHRGNVPNKYNQINS